MARNTKRSRLRLSLLAAGVWILLAALPLFAQTIQVRSNFRAGDLPIVHQNRTAPVIFSPEDHKVVHITASDLAADIERVTGKKPRIANDHKQQLDTAVIIGTLG